MTERRQYSKVLIMHVIVDNQDNTESAAGATFLVKCSVQTRLSFLFKA